MFPSVESQDMVGRATQASGTLGAAVFVTQRSPVRAAVAKPGRREVSDDR